jgi:hypothetical protein
MEEEQKKPLEIIKGVYLGKEFKSKGNKNGKDWTKYQVSIKKNQTDQYAVKLGAFATTKGLDKIQEGDFVKAGYKLGTPYNAHGKLITPKDLMYIAKATEESKQELSGTSGINMLDRKEFEGITMQGWEEFEIQYKDLLKDDPRFGATHMIGSYLMTHCTNVPEIAELIKRANKAITPELKQ